MNDPNPMLHQKCPCGEIPGTLIIEINQDGKYGRVLGDCCGEWAIEFKIGVGRTKDQAALKAQVAWNEAPRGEVATG